MTYKAEINVMPHKELLDPQGKAVESSMSNLHLSSIHGIRIGKHISLKVDADTEADARKMVDEACKKLLSNPVIEFFEVEISAVATE